ncbi:MAG: hypothetical protein KZQ83_12140 [gamma proteobacterium symbiont of Taylorina sp.]|nr:hypothetical protein [gamma proteobacterium symbiont of Taylorina sp.]
MFNKIIRKIYKKLSQKNNKILKVKNIPSQANKNLTDIKRIEKKKKVFVIGMSKTGTTSMETLLDNVGYRVCRGHWNNKDTNYLCACYNYNDINEILNITKYYDAFADVPWGGTLLYEELVKLYPEAYFILTTRSTDNWYESLVKMYEQFDDNLETTMDTMRSFGAYGNYLFFRKMFAIDNLANSETKMKQYYNKYNQGVRKFFKNNEFNFMEIDITKKGFEPSVILEYINKPLNSNINMPHANKGNY